MVYSVLYVEGGTNFQQVNDSIEEIRKSEDIDVHNENLRLAFQQLIPNKNVALGFGNSQTVQIAKTKMKSSPKAAVEILIDLDSLDSNNKSKKQQNLAVPSDMASYFMVAELESWFLSQPDIFPDKIKNKIQDSDYLTIENPKEHLKQLYKDAGVKPIYNEVKTASELLLLLDQELLQATFPDFKALREKLALA